MVRVPRDGSLGGRLPRPRPRTRRRGRPPDAGPLLLEPESERDARREFQIALEQSTDPGERTYLGWCIQAIDTEPERKRQQEAIAAKEELNRRADRAMSLAQAGKFPEAVAEVAELTKNPSWNAAQWYDFACVYSLASIKIADKKNEYADRAMELLQKAVKAGWNDAKHTASDTDLAPLRNRDDFKKLLGDLETKAAAAPAEKP